MSQDQEHTQNPFAQNPDEQSKTAEPEPMTEEELEAQIREEEQAQASESAEAEQTGQQQPKQQKAEAKQQGQSKKQSKQTQQKAGSLKSSSSFARNFEIKEVSKDLQVFVQQIDDYIDAMHPSKRQNKEQLLRNQAKLHSIFNTLLSQEQRLFEEAVKILLTAIRANRDTVFSEYSIMRGFPELRINKSQRQRLEQLINIFFVAADSQNPRDISHSVDFSVVFRYVRNNREQQLLQSFFQT